MQVPVFLMYSALLLVNLRQRKTSYVCALIGSPRTPSGLQTFFLAERAARGERFSRYSDVFDFYVN
jgi:hypothetical protein